MTSTVDQPTMNALDQDEQLLHQNRTLKLILLVVAIIALGLGGVLIYSAASNDDSASAVPADVQQVIDDYITAMENRDYAAFQEAVTDDFTRAAYTVEQDGTGEYRGVQDVEDFDWLEDENSVVYDVVTTGSEVVRGDGPWVVSVPQDWVQVGTGTGYESIYTFAIVDKDGTLQIEDAYWAGIGPVLVED